MNNVQKLSRVVLLPMVEVNFLQVICRINYPVFVFTLQVHSQYLTPREVAFLYNIHERTVRKWACNGRLKRHFFGRHPFYKRQELFIRSSF